MTTTPLLLDKIRAERKKGTLFHQMLYKRRYRLPADQHGAIAVLYESLEQAITLAMGSEVILVDQAARYVSRRMADGPIDLHDLECLLPPFPTTWVEYDDIADDSVSRAGCLLLRYDLRRLDGQARQAVLLALTPDGLVHPNFDHPFIQTLVQAESTWLVALIPFFDSLTLRQICGSVITFWLVLDEQGSPRGPIWPMFQPFAHVTAGLTTEAQQREFVSAFDSLWATALVAMSLLHCQNVRSPQTTPDPGVAKHLALLGRPPTTVYRTLTIDPPPTMAGTPHGPRAQANGPQRFSMVRGHFATYGMPVKGVMRGKLFGRYAMRIFIPDHTRGSIEAGMVVKDYELGTHAAPGGGGQ